MLKGKQKCVLMCACVCLFVWCCSSPVQKNCSFLNEWTIFLAIFRMLCNVAFTFTFLFFSILWSYIHLYVQVYFISRLGLLIVPLDSMYPLYQYPQWLAVQISYTPIKRKQRVLCFHEH